MVMAVFAYIYHQSFVVPQTLSVEMILDQVIIFILLCILLCICISKLTFKMFNLWNCRCSLQISMNLTFDEQQALYWRLGEILQQGFARMS